MQYNLVRCLRKVAELTYQLFNMNPLRTICLMACFMAAAMGSATQRSHNSNSLSANDDPSNWVTPNELDKLPSLSEVTLKRLEQMSVEEGAELVDKLYHLSQYNRVFKPNYSPEPSQIKGFIVGPRGQKIEFNLNNFVETARRQPNFGDEEVTIYIQGLPRNWQDNNKATQKLVQAYMQRYNLQAYAGQNNNNNNNEQRSSSEEQDVMRQQNDEQNTATTTGDLVVINLGDCIDDFEQYATLDVERLGAIIGNRLVQLTNTANVPQEIIHLIGHGQGANVAGVAGRQFTRQTGHKLRRITGLDPAKMFGKQENSLNGLARGDADFVDAIHTSAHGLGTPMRCADIDFYPNGPAAGVPGADNVVEASVRAVRYFAESVRPGSERNFPAVAATSLKEYKQNNGYGKRVYMGISASYDVRGDYILQVNPKSPFGRNTSAKQQNGYHAVHDAWSQHQSQHQNQHQQRL